MIAYLCGKIKLKNDKAVILNVAGVGYEIKVSQPILEKIKIDEEKEFFTHLHVREDIMELYGFETEAEKKFFELLISVSGVGPKSALQVLSIAKISEIQQAILHSDPTLLRKVSGIGQKTAERLVVELKNKLDILTLDKDNVSLKTKNTEAFDALQTLGYSSNEIREVLRQIDNNLEDENEIIKSALKILGKIKK